MQWLAERLLYTVIPRTSSDLGKPLASLRHGQEEGQARSAAAAATAAAGAVEKHR
jgi:hypothetical protein